MKTLELGRPIPELDTLDQFGHRHRSSDYRGRWLVVTFYIRDNTPICTLQTRAFQAQESVLSDRGVAVLGISPQSAESHARFAEKCQLSFPLLDDRQGRLQRAFGVRTLIGRTKRVTFLVDPQGTVADVYRNEILGPSHVEWALRRLDELQRASGPA